MMDARPGKIPEPGEAMKAKKTRIKKLAGEYGRSQSGAELPGGEAVLLSGEQHSPLKRPFAAAAGGSPAPFFFPAARGAVR